jgi:hypothetical protein
MDQKTKTAEATKAYGKDLPEALSYEYSWTEYATTEELVAAKDELTLEEQRKVRNVERQGKARQAELTKRLTAAGIEKPTLETDDQLRLREMFKVLMSSKKYTEEKAREVASANLGIDWAE